MQFKKSVQILNILSKNKIILSWFIQKAILISKLPHILSFHIEQTDYIPALFARQIPDIETK